MTTTPRVSVQIVTFHSADVIGSCLDSLAGQTFTDFRIRILDNASTDATRDILAGRAIDVIPSDTNTGFCAAHNRLARQWPADYVLFLNPDTVLEPDFIGELVSALDADPKAGSVCGKLLRMDGRTIDSTGIVMTRNGRHLDRGADTFDEGQFETSEEVFGPSGAAALYRYACLEHTAIDGQFFDEDFFAYREDADLAWRCRLMGWTSIYEPKAVGRHARRVTPERRSALPAQINRNSVKNRFLLRINNMTAALYRRMFWSVTIRDLQVLGYVCVREWSSIPAFAYLWRSRSGLSAKRNAIQRRRRQDVDLERWFC